MADGGVVTETLTRLDAEKMMVGVHREGDDVKRLPAVNFTNIATLRPAEGGRTVVEWKARFYRGYPNPDPPPELNDDVAIAAVTALLKANIAALKAQAEANPGGEGVNGERPFDAAALRPHRPGTPPREQGEGRALWLIASFLLAFSRPASAAEAFVTAQSADAVERGRSRRHENRRDAPYRRQAGRRRGEPGRRARLCVESRRPVRDRHRRSHADDHAENPV